MVCHPTRHGGHRLDAQQPADGGAQRLVGHRAVEMDNRGLEDVGGRCTTTREPDPAVVPYDDRQLVLRTRE